MNVRVRFAPSPTGLLHIGGARTALFNWRDLDTAVSQVENPCKVKPARRHIYGRWNPRVTTRYFARA
jgi:hypothetical protein